MKKDKKKLKQLAAVSIFVGLLLLLPLFILVLSPWLLHEYYLDKHCPMVKAKWPCRGENCEDGCLRRRNQLKLVRG